MLSPILNFEVKIDVTSLHYLLYVYDLWRSLHVSHIKLKAYWATWIEWPVLTWDYHIPYSYGHRQPLNLQHSKYRLLTRQKQSWLSHWYTYIFNIRIRRKPSFSFSLIYKQSLISLYFNTNQWAIPYLNISLAVLRGNSHTVTCEKWRAERLNRFLCQLLDIHFNKIGKLS